VAGVAKVYGAEGALVPTGALLTAFTRLGLDFSQDPALKERRCVPATWCFPANGEQKLQKLFALFEHGPSAGVVDVSELLLQLGLLHSPLGWPSLQELLDVRTSLEKVMPAGASWPDFFITQEQLAAVPLFADPSGEEAKFAARYAAQTADSPSLFPRARAQLAWLGRLLARFPAKGQRQQSFEMELAWYNYLTRQQEDAQRNAELVDDTKSTGSTSPRVSDGLTPLLTPAQPDTPMFHSGSDAEGDAPGPPPLPPRPQTPRGLPELPPGSLSVRQLLASLCLGGEASEGITRACAVLGPKAGATAAIPLPTLHALLLQSGCRPSTPPVTGDGQPACPSIRQLCDALEVKESAKLTAAEFLAHGATQGLMARYGLARRHRRAEIGELYPADMAAS